MSCSITAAAANPPAYTQTFEITYASHREAETASLVPLPVYDGKEWALSARWDDNHLGSLAMHDIMVKHGLKGTFYLNATDLRGRFGESLVEKLTSDGFTIGVHSQTHPFLPTLGPNAMMMEVLANRVEREAQADIPIVSIAFPFGRWDSDDDPTAATQITEVLRRSGLHHATYSGFARKNPNAGPFEFSTSHLIVPGDSVVNPEVFQANLEKFFKFSKNYQKKSYNISLSTHARQKKDQLETLDGLFTELLTRSDWWRCNQNEYAAYFQQVHRSKIERIGVNGAVAWYRIVRPTPAWSGATVPLTLEVTGGEIKGVQGIPADHTWRVVGDRTFVNLTHDPEMVEPRRIDAIENPTNQVPSQNSGASSDFDGLRVWLHHDRVQAKLVLDLVNHGKRDLTGLHVTLRLPLGHQDGLRNHTLDDLAVGGQRQEVFNIGMPLDDAAFHEGDLYYVAQLDFRAGNEQGRIFATTTVEQSVPPRSCIRDAAKMLGPVVLADLDLDSLQAQARPDNSYIDLNDAPTMRWFSSSETDRKQFSGKRLPTFLDDDNWLTQAKEFNRKKHTFVVAVDFMLDADVLVTIDSQMPISHAYLNGASVNADQPMGQTRIGTNRLVALLEITDKRIYWKPEPIWFQLETQDTTLEYVLPP